MSGGSLDYVGSKIANGNITGVRRYLPGIIEAVDREIDMLRAGRYPDKAGAEVALAALSSSLRRLEHDITEIASRMKQFEDVGHVADRLGSGDSGPEDLVDAAIDWMYRRLGVARPK